MKRNTAPSQCNGIYVKKAKVVEGAKEQIQNLQRSYKKLNRM